MIKNWRKNKRFCKNKRHAERSKKTKKRQQRRKPCKTARLKGCTGSASSVKVSSTQKSTSSRGIPVYPAKLAGSRSKSTIRLGWSRSKGC